jgi:hypothetical protein
VAVRILKKIRKLKSIKKYLAWLSSPNKMSTTKRASRKHVGEPHSPYNKKLAKLNRILENEEDITINKRIMDEIRNLCIDEGGCVNGKMRKKIWPLLLHTNNNTDLQCMSQILYFLLILQCRK